LAVLKNDEHIISYSQVPECNPLIKGHCIIEVDLIREDTISKDFAAMIESTFDLELQGRGLAKKNAIDQKINC
jgi:hypothetical protein